MRPPVMASTMLNSRSRIREHVENRGHLPDVLAKVPKNSRWLAMRKNSAIITRITLRPLRHLNAGHALHGHDVGQVVHHPA